MRLRQTPEGTTVLCKDVPQAQQLCEQLLDQNKSAAVDPDSDALNAQFSALNELTRAKTEHTDAVLAADDVEAMRKIEATFPRSIIIEYLSIVRGQKDYVRREEICLQET